MTEPLVPKWSDDNPADRQAFMVALIWVAFVGASVVLLIDWKLKQDILSMITAFDKRMEADRESPLTGVRFNPDFNVAPLLAVYDDAVAAATPAGPTASKTRTRAARKPVNGTSEDHGGLPAGPVGMAGLTTPAEAGT